MDYSNKRKKPLILHVDDSETVLLVTQSMLEFIGVDTLTASTGAEGIKLAESELPDLILMDAMMPGMDGYQATKSLKRNSATRNIPILMVTGSDAAKDVEKALASGANGYVVKPIHADRLKAKIEEWLTLPETRNL